MSNNRNIKIWVVLVGAMTAGAVILMALDDKKVSAGGFSLASFQELDSVVNALKTSQKADLIDWKAIEVSYSGTVGGTVANVALARGDLGPDSADFHFLIGNGDGAEDGRIIATKKWINQKKALEANSTIKVVIVADGKDVRPTDTQIKRLANLLDSLSRKYDIDSDFIFQPVGIGM